jgi:hypothetical protein
MDRNTPMGGGRTGTGSAANPATARIEGVAQRAPQTTDRIADNPASQVDRLRGRHTSLSAAPPRRHHALPNGHRPFRSRRRKYKRDLRRPRALQCASVRLPLSPARWLSVIC